MSEFWDEFIGSSGLSRDTSSLDNHLSKIATQRRSVQALTDAMRAAEALDTSVPSGTRVAFKGHSLGVLLAYEQAPADGALGTVVMVRTAMGDSTSNGDMVFVKFDHGPCFQVHREHLQRVSQAKTATGFRRRVSTLGDLSDFLRVGSTLDLVHKATRDLWVVKADGDEYMIERLFDEDGSPLKV